MDELIRRSYMCEVRAESDGQVITGRPIVYNSRTDLGWFDEIIESGALDRTDLTDVRFLVNHDTSRIPLARSRRNNGNSTMQLITDSDGMGIRAILDTEKNSEAKALFSAWAVHKFIVYAPWATNLPKFCSCKAFIAFSISGVVGESPAHAP